MRHIVGNPAAGLASLGVYTAAFVLIDAMNSSAESGGPAPGAVVAGLNVVAGLAIPLIVLAQRSPSLSPRWRFVNSVAVVDACLLLLFSIGHWIDVLARPADYWRPAMAPGSIALLIAVVTALVQPGDPYRRVREGLIAAGCIAVPGFCALLITSHFDGGGRPATSPMVVAFAVLSAGTIGLIAYEFGSRRGRSGSDHGP